MSGTATHLVVHPSGVGNAAPDSNLVESNTHEVMPPSETRIVGAARDMRIVQSPCHALVSVTDNLRPGNFSLGALSPSNSTSLGSALTVLHGAVMRRQRTLHGGQNGILVSVVSSKRDASGLAGVPRAEVRDDDRFGPGGPRAG